MCGPTFHKVDRRHINCKTSKRYTVVDNCVDLAVFLGGTVNLNNLKLFRIVIRDGCPVLEKGTMPINPGEITSLD